MQFNIKVITTFPLSIYFCFDYSFIASSSVLWCICSFCLISIISFISYELFFWLCAFYLNGFFGFIQSRIYTKSAKRFHCRNINQSVKTETRTYTRCLIHLNCSICRESSPMPQYSHVAPQIFQYLQFTQL